MTGSPKVVSLDRVKLANVPSSGLPVCTPVSPRYTNSHTTEQTETFPPVPYSIRVGRRVVLPSRFGKEAGVVPSR